VSVSYDIMCATADCTYRQLDHWCRRGYIRVRGWTPAGGNRVGSGNDRRFDDQEVEVVTLMVRLVHAGFVPVKAAEVARVVVERNGRSVRIAEDLVVTDTSREHVEVAS